MARVKILLDPGETEIDADLLLEKALVHHSSGDAHTETFADPAMADLAQQLENKHSAMYVEMLREIGDLLDKEYSSGSE